MKIGIICDNYKLNKFKAELKKEGYKFSTKPVTFKGNLTVIKVTGTIEDQPKIQELCERVENHFLKLKN